MTQTVPDISPLMPMHQDPLLVGLFTLTLKAENGAHDIAWSYGSLAIRRLYHDVSCETYGRWMLDGRYCPGIVSIFLELMMTSSNGNIFRVTGPLCGEFTGHRWIPLTMASDAELWCFAWINGWVNNRDAGVLRRHRAHYDVTVM